MEGPAEIVLHCRNNIDKYSIHPLSKKISATVSGEIIRFSLVRPEKILLKVNDMPSILIFATPPETSIPDRDDPNVIYFGPGVHHVGRLALESNQIVYMASGARVYVL